jgi:hypothetical protein
MGRCVILPNMSNVNDDWVDAIQQRGLVGVVRTALDVLAPLGPLAAQLLYVTQPMTGLFGWQETVGKMAHLLEDADELEALRQLRV